MEWPLRLENAYDDDGKMALQWLRFMHGMALDKWWKLLSFHWIRSKQVKISYRERVFLRFCFNSSSGSANDRDQLS